MPKNVSIYIPDDLANRMEDFKEVNWSEIARIAIEDYIENRRTFQEKTNDLMNKYEKIITELEHEKYRSQNMMNELKYNIEKNRPSITITNIEDVYIEPELNQYQNQKSMQLRINIKNTLNERLILDRIICDIRFRDAQLKDIVRIEEPILDIQQIEPKAKIEIWKDFHHEIDITTLNNYVSHTKQDIKVRTAVTVYFIQNNEIKVTRQNRESTISVNQWENWYSSIT